MADEHLYGEECERTAQEINGNILTDSESDDPSAYIKSVHDEASQKLIAKKVAAIKRQIRQKRAKYISQQHFLGRKKSKSLDTIASNFQTLAKKFNAMLKATLLVRMPGDIPE